MSTFFHDIELELTGETENGFFEWASHIAEEHKKMSNVMPRMTLVNIPDYIARCFPRKKRLSKKLAKRHNIRHWQDLKKVKVWNLNNAVCVGVDYNDRDDSSEICTATYKGDMT
jgi:hypothetical protein